MTKTNDIRVEERETTTRDAVETAIRMSKIDKYLSWEEILSRDPIRISRWKEKQPGSGDVKRRAKSLPLQPLSLEEALGALLTTRPKDKSERQGKSQGEGEEATILED